MRPIRVAAVVSHPIQYQAPLFRYIANEPRIELEVLFEHDHGVREDLDPGFGRAIHFDVPLLEGYRSTFLTAGSGFNRSNRALMRGLRDLVCRLRNGRFDWVWVHGYATSTTLTAIATAKAFTIPILLRGESTLLFPTPIPHRWAKTAILKSLMKSCAAFGYVGEQNRNFYLANGARTNQLIFAPYSIDNALFAANAAHALRTNSAGDLRNRLGITEDQKVCLFVGKLIARKRPLDLVNALCALPDKYFALFAGDGPLRPIVEDSLKQYRVSGIVQGFVNQTELATYYAASDMLILPSEYETWGLVANEAMACGKPVILSHLVGSGYDLIDPRPSTSGAMTGQVYPCGDVAALAKAISDVDIGLATSAIEIQTAVLERIARYDISQTAAGLITAFTRDIRS